MTSKQGLIVAGWLLWAWCGATSYATEYANHDEALRQGTRLLREKNHAEAQVALEAALKLARDDKQRLQAYQALITPYRQLPEIDKMLTAQEFILRHAETKAKRKNAASDVTSFLHQRGKLDAGVERYEAQFKADPKDIAALHVLVAIYKQRRDEGLVQALQVQADSLDRELARKLAEKYEAAAAAATSLAAWNWKEAAVAWLEAEDNVKALAAAQKSAASPPEERTTILTYYWREALGNVFLKAGEPKLAVPQFEAALLVAPSQNHREGIAKQLAEAKR